MESQAPSPAQPTPAEPAREIDSCSRRYKLMNSLAGTYVLLGFLAIFLTATSEKPDLAVSAVIAIFTATIGHFFAFGMAGYFMLRMSESYRYYHPDGDFTWNQAAKDILLFATGAAATAGVIWIAYTTGQAENGNQWWHFLLALAGLATALPGFIAIARQNPEFHN